MGKTTALVWLVALVAGLAVLAGPTNAPPAAAADTDRPWLGVYMQQLTPELREGIDYNGSGGVLVSSVVRDGPADRAGIRKGDVILRFGSRGVDSPSQLSDMVGDSRAGQSVAVEVFRDGQRRTLDVRLGTRPADEEMEGPDVREAPGTREAPEPESPDTPVLPDMPRVHDMLRGFDFQGPGTMRIFANMDRGRLGVQVQSLNPDLGDYFGLKDGKGALVIEVVKDTPASRAGLKSGDVITRVDDRAVANTEDLIGALRGKEGKVALRVVRHGTPRTIEATLEKSPAASRGGLGMMEDRPGMRRDSRVRTQDSEQMRRELDRLRLQIDELRQRLDREQGDEGND